MPLNALIIFIAALTLLLWAGPYLVAALVRIAYFLGWPPFIISFILVAFVGTLPNVSVGISSALHGIPELSFGDVIGGNLIDITLGVSVAALIAGGLPLRERMLRKSALITAAVAILPLALAADGIVHRADGVILIGTFLFYAGWLFANRKQFPNHVPDVSATIGGLRDFFVNLGRALLGMGAILLAAEAMVRASTTIAISLKIPFYLVGILVVAVGNALPEVYFAAVAARGGQKGMVLGDLMGSIIAASTLVIGVASIIHPITIDGVVPFSIARAALVIAAVFLFLFARTGNSITRREGLFLLSLYILFLVGIIVYEVILV